MITLQQFFKAWNDFWFKPESPIPVAVFRILFGLIVLQLSWYLHGDFQWYFGPKAIISQAANIAWNGGARLNVFDWLPATAASSEFLFAVFVVAAFCLTIGFCTRLSAVIVYLGLISIDARNSLIFTGADNVMRVESFLLIFSQCGQALSVDLLIKRWLKKQPLWAPAEAKSPWALRLLQVQIALVYWAAYSAKICGQTWIDGTAVYYITHIIEENKYALPYLYDHLWTARILSWLTLVGEFALCILIWIKELRLPIIIGGIIMHLFFDFTLIIPQFQTIMIASLMCFIEPSTYEKFWRFVKSKSVARAEAL